MRSLACAIYLVFTFAYILVLRPLHHEGTGLASPGEAPETEDQEHLEDSSNHLREKSPQKGSQTLSSVAPSSRIQSLQDPSSHDQLSLVLHRMHLMEWSSPFILPRLQSPLAKHSMGGRPADCLQAEETETEIKVGPATRSEAKEAGSELRSNASLSWRWRFAFPRRTVDCFNPNKADYSFGRCPTTANCEPPSSTDGRCSLEWRKGENRPRGFSRSPGTSGGFEISHGRFDATGSHSPLRADTCSSPGCHSWPCLQSHQCSQGTRQSGRESERVGCYLADILPKHGHSNRGAKAKVRHESSHCSETTEREGTEATRSSEGAEGQSLLYFSEGLRTILRRTTGSSTKRCLNHGGHAGGDYRRRGRGREETPTYTGCQQPSAIPNSIAQEKGRGILCDTHGHRSEETQLRENRGALMNHLFQDDWIVGYFRSHMRVHVLAPFDFPLFLSMREVSVLCFLHHDPLQGQEDSYVLAPLMKAAITDGYPAYHQSNSFVLRPAFYTEAFSLQEEAHTFIEIYTNSSPFFEEQNFEIRIDGTFRYHPTLDLVIFFGMILGGLFCILHGLYRNLPDLDLTRIHASCPLRLRSQRINRPLRRPQPGRSHGVCFLLLWLSISSHLVPQCRAETRRLRHESPPSGADEPQTLGDENTLLDITNLFIMNQLDIQIARGSQQILQYPEAIRDMIDNPIFQETNRMEEALQRTWELFNVPTDVFACALRTRRLPTMPPNICHHVQDGSHMDFAVKILREWDDLPDREWAISPTRLFHPVFANIDGFIFVLVEHDPEQRPDAIPVAVEIITEDTYGQLASALFAKFIQDPLTPEQLVLEWEIFPCHYTRCEFWVDENPIYEHQNFEASSGAHLQVYIPSYSHLDQLRRAGITGMRWLQLWADHQQQLSHPAARIHLRYGRSPIRSTGQAAIFRIPIPPNFEDTINLDVRTTTTDEILEQIILEQWMDLIEENWKWTHLDESWHDSPFLEKFAHVLIAYDTSQSARTFLTSIEWNPIRPPARIRAIQSETWSPIATLIIRSGAARECLFDDFECSYFLDGKQVDIKDLAHIRHGSFLRIVIDDRDQTMQCQSIEFAEDIASLMQTTRIQHPSTDHRILALTSRPWTRATVWFHVQAFHDQCHSLATTIMFRTFSNEDSTWEERAIVAFRQAIPTHPDRQRAKVCRIIWPQPPPLIGSLGIVQLIIADFEPTPMDFPILMDIQGLPRVDRTIIHFWSDDGRIPASNIVQRRHMTERCSQEGWCTFRYMGEVFDSRETIPLRPFTFLELIFVPYPVDSPDSAECDTLTPSSQLTGTSSIFHHHDPDYEYDQFDLEQDDLEVASLLQVLALPLQKVIPQAIIVLLRLPPPGNGPKEQLRVTFHPLVEVWVPHEDLNSSFYVHDLKMENDFLADFVCTTDEHCENPFVLDLMTELGWSPPTSSTTIPKRTLCLEELIPDPHPGLTSHNTTHPPRATFDAVTEGYIHIKDTHLNHDDSHCFFEPWPTQLLSHPGDIPLHAFSQMALQLASTRFSSTPEKIHIYTDGSFRQGKLQDGSWIPTKATWAFVVVFQHPEGFAFEGFLTGDVITDFDTRFDLQGIGALSSTPLTAEQSALCWAATWAIQFIANFGQKPPEVHFHFDSVVAGFKAGGLWGPPPSKDTLLSFATRAYFQILHNICETSLHHVKSHTGQPWNELADSIARARLNSEIEDSTPMVTWPSSRTQREFLAWIGNLIPSSGLVNTHDDIYIQQVRPAESLSFDWCPIEKQTTTRKVATNFSGTIASYNVLTLRQRGALELLRTQCSKQGIHLIGLQETRDRENKMWQSQDYIRLTSAATSSGLGGTQLWIHREAPFFNIDGKAIRISKNFITVIHASPQLLCATVTGNGICLSLVVGHAPHSLSEDTDEWWTSFHNILNDIPREYPCILMIDANCRMHGFDDEWCGPASPPIPHDHTDASQHFHDLLVDRDLFLPSTFDSLHSGTHYTWHIGPNARARLDYIALPISWKTSVRRSFVDESIRAGTIDHDHSLVAAQVNHNFSTDQTALPRRLAFDRLAIATPEGQAICAKILSEAPKPPAWVDSSIHCHILETYCKEQLVKHFPFQRRKCKKSFIRTETYSYVLQLRSLRRHMRLLSQQRGRQILTLLFLRWKETRCPSAEQPHLIPLKEIDFALARNLQTIDKYKILLSKNLKIDHQNHQAATVEAIANARPSQIFDALKPLLPKHRRGLFSAESLPGLTTPSGPTKSTAQTARTFQEYFGRAEAGIQVTPTELEKNFLTSQKLHVTQIAQLCPSVPLHEISTLQSLEAKIRKLKSGKTPGPDGIPGELLKADPSKAAEAYYGLILKMNLLGAEPIQWKGGFVKPIYKRGDHRDPSCWRNILLSSTPGKLGHSLLRDSLDQAYQRHHTDSQFGGVSGASIAIPTLALRSFLGLCRKKLISSAVLFVDGMEAFYRMLREMVFDIDDRGAIEERLTISGYTQATQDLIINKLDEANALCRQHVSPHRQAIMKAIHANSWFYVTGETSKLCTTKSGSRPGDPVADVLYNMLMSRALTTIREKFTEAGIVNHTTLSPDGIMPDHIRPSTPLPLVFDGQAWVDDLAFMLMSDSAATLLDTVAKASSIVYTELAAVGVQINLNSGKTEALVSMRGKGSRELRRQLHCEDDSMVTFNTHDLRPSSLGVTPKYKYLGSLISTTRGCVADIRRRTALAFVVLKSLRKAVFTNQKLSLKGKIAVLNSVVLSKFLATAGSWILTTKQEIQCFQANVMKLYRYIFFAIFKKDRTQHFSNDYILNHLGVLDPMELIHIHHIRTLISAVHTAPSYVWALLNQDGDWFGLLQKATEWLHDYLFPHPANEQDTFDLSILIEWILYSPKEVKKFLRRTQTATFEHRQRVLQSQIWIDDWAQLLPQAGFKSTKNHITEISRHYDDGYLCGHCGSAHVDYRSLSVHLSKVHGVYSDAKRWAQLSFCEVCMTEFHTQPKLRRHFERGGHHCLIALINHYEEPPQPTTPIDASDNMKPHFRITGPLAPWFAEAATKQGLPRVPVEQRPPPRQHQDSKEEDLSSFYYDGTDVTVPCQMPQALVVLHLFSGRRREQDLQWQLEQEAVRQNCMIFVVSLDLAVDAQRGNLASSTTKEYWLMKIRDGFVFGFVVGPPCDTYTRSRFRKDCGPPPIRSGRYPWGIRGIAHKFHQQLMLANGFAQFALTLMLHAVIFGLRGLLEHPAPYQEPDSCCIWDLLAVHLLRAHPAVDFFVIRQGEYGQISAKPTGLLAANMPGFTPSFAQSKLPRKDWNLNSITMGRAASGKGYNTAPLKEYPPAMNLAIARTMLHPERLMLQVREPAKIDHFLAEIGDMVVGLEEGETHWLPDYNPDLSTD